jgi:hypothetical protein
MESTERLLFIAALITFLIAMQTRRRSHAYVGAAMLIFILVISLTHHDQPASETARDERTIEKTLIDDATQLALQAHGLLLTMPHSKAESLRAQRSDAPAARFYAAEQDWLNRAEHGKPLNSFVDENASTAAIRIVAADSFLTGAVQSAVEHCNGKDADKNMALAEKIIADARASLNGHGDPHFPTPDLTNQLNGQNNCADDGG